MISRPARLSVHLAHGASGTAASMRGHVDALHALGVDAHALELPRGNAERAVPTLLRQVPREHGTVVVGGHSYGGRVASLAAADDGFAGLVLLSYPLHRPGHPEDLRTGHWSRIRCPVLLLSGDRDPFARIDLLRVEVARLARAELAVYPGLGHGLGPAVDDAMGRVAEWLTKL